VSSPAHVAQANIRIDALTARVDQLTSLICEMAKRIAALEKSTPPHMANVERR